MKIIIVGSWNTDGGVCRHTTPIVEQLIILGIDVKVLTHYKKDSHGYPLNVKDEDFVTRCFSKTKLDSRELIRLVKEGYNTILLEDLGMLPMEDLYKVIPKLKKSSKIYLLNHDNVPKSDGDIFWKVVDKLDGVINFLSEQNEFMSKHFPKDKTYLIEYPCYNVNKSLCKKLNLSDKNIILLFDDTYSLEPLKVIKEVYEVFNLYLVILVYNRNRKMKVKKELKRLGYSEYEIRIDGASSWQVRQKYVEASSMIILDKGKGVTGEGAVLSSTLFQIMPWTVPWKTPIIVRDSRFFDLWNNEVLKYSNNDDGTELKKCIKLVLTNKVCKKLDKESKKFIKEHLPEKITNQLIDIFTNNFE